MVLLFAIAFSPAMRSSGLLCVGQHTCFRGLILVALALGACNSVAPEVPVEVMSAADSAAVEADISATEDLEQHVAAPDSAVLASADPVSWVDSLPIPPWIGADPLARRPYRSLGSGGGSGVALVAEPYTPPFIVARTQGRSVMMIGDVLGESGTGRASLRLAGGLRLVGECSSRIDVSGDPLRGEPLRVRGRLVRPGGDWMFHLASSSSACEGTGRRGYPRSQPNRSQRESVVAAVRSAGIAPQVAYGPGDLRAFVETPKATDGTRYIFASLRQAEGTQLAPPPAVHQTVLVLALPASGAARVLWSEHLYSSTERLGLAGVQDTDGDRIAEGLFVGMIGGRGVLLRVAPDSLGAWRTIGRTDLGSW